MPLQFLTEDFVEAEDDLTLFGVLDQILGPVDKSYERQYNFVIRYNKFILLMSAILVFLRISPNYI